jgi:hypothetical protein
VPLRLVGSEMCIRDSSRLYCFGEVYAHFDSQLFCEILGSDD